MIKDPTVFSDVADVLNIAEPAFVEKDYYAVQLIRELLELKNHDFRMIFSGGTCLSKAYQNTHRMSEDIDIKFTAIKSDLKKKHRKQLSEEIKNKIKKSNIFSILEEPIISSVYRSQIYGVQYPKIFSHTALKPFLKLELVESIIYEPIYSFPVGSMYAEAMKEMPEVSSIECVNMESIIVEKLIALLWRASAWALVGDIKEDKFLIRHMYDIHVLLSTKSEDINESLLKNISVKSLQEHINRYENRHPDFASNPKNVLSHGFNEIKSNPLYKERYENFLLPLVYVKNKLSWNKAFASLENLYRKLYVF